MWIPRASNDASKSRHGRVASVPVCSVQPFPSEDHPRRDPSAIFRGAKAATVYRWHIWSALVVGHTAPRSGFSGRTLDHGLVCLPWCSSIWMRVSVFIGIGWRNQVPAWAGHTNAGGFRAGDLVGGSILPGIFVHLWCKRGARGAFVCGGHSRSARWFTVPPVTLGLSKQGDGPWAGVAYTVFPPSGSVQLVPPALDDHWCRRCFSM